MLDSLSPKEKRTQLSKIKSEVNDFHPLLHAVLPKLPRVTDVDYTHGAYEKGADFVLTRADDTLGYPEHIGVLAKIGKITTSLTSIYDQIDDCNQIRYTLSGKKAIRLDEIWIVTNENISNNAKEKIYNKYSVSKIKFYQNSDLIKLIDKFLEHYWTSIPVPIGEYLIKLQASVEEEDIVHSLLPPNTKKFYIEQKLIPIESYYKKRQQKGPNKFSLIELIEKQNITIIEGEPGAGKSQMVRSVIKNFSTPREFLKNKLIPVAINYVELYSKYECDPNKLLKRECFKVLFKQVQEGAKIVLFIDGFDEIMDSREINDELRNLIEFAESNNFIRLVITTRPLNVVDYKELLPQKALAYEIMPLSMTQIAEFFKNILSSAAISGRLLEDIKKSELFKQLPRNPISAILLAQLINDNSQDLPSNLTDVYQKYSELMLGRWDIEKGLQSQQEFEAASSIITYLARYFVEHKIILIGKEEAKQHFNEYLSKRNFTIDPDLLFNRVVTRSGIIQLDLKNNRIYFKHRSFRDFFYALYKIQHPAQGFIDRKTLSLAWRSVYFFYIGLHKDCEELLSEILSIKPSNVDERFMRYVNMADYFLAAYATPYGVVETYLPILISEARDLYLDIINNRVDSPLKELPEILVLEFFQAVTNSSYSYRFFLKAMDSAVLQLCSDQSCTEEEKAYSLFFLSTLYRAMEKENPFDGLLEDFQNKLPLPVQFGIYYNSKHITHQSSILKRNERKLKRAMKKNPQLRKYARRIHTLPVGKNVIKE